MERDERPDQHSKLSSRFTDLCPRVIVARRDERQEQRRAATKEAERQKRVAWQNNISMEDPDRVNRMSGNYQPRVRKPNV